MKSNVIEIERFGFTEVPAEWELEGAPKIRQTKDEKIAQIKRQINNLEFAGRPESIEAERKIRERAITVLRERLAKLACQ